MAAQSLKLSRMVGTKVPGAVKPQWGQVCRTVLRLGMWGSVLLVLAGCECAAGVAGQACTSNSDCDEAICQDGICVDPSLTDGGLCVDTDGDRFGEGCGLGPDCDDTDPTQTGMEVCDGMDNDCDGDVDEDVLSPCGNCDPTCRIDAVGVGAGGFDIEEDESEGVSVDDEGALVLDSREVDTHFIWIANTGEGTVSKVDTRTYVEVGRYVTGPAGRANDPSRTSVNTLGDVYVGNRGGRTVTKISALGAGCPDTNDDGVVTTSTGPDDVLAWGMDDCVLWNTALPGGGVIRAVAAQDVEGLDFTLETYVWLGGYDGVAWKLHGETGDIIVQTPAPVRTYGFALDGRGQLWISGRGDAALGRIDTTRCLDEASCDVPVCDADGVDCIKQQIPLPRGAKPYGITVDLAQRVWTANHGSTNVTSYDPSAPEGDRWAVANVGLNCHGIAADGAGWVWAACWNAGVVRLLGDDPTTFTVVSDTSGFSCKGMAVDFDGKIWAINRSNNSAIVVEPGPGLLEAVSTTGVADQIVSPYTYSDMTGQQLRLATNPRGHYRRVFEGCAEDEPTTGTLWGELRWSAETPPGTRLVMRARTASSRGALADAEWVLVAEVPSAASPADIAAAFEGAGVSPERFLEVEAQLSSMRDATREVITPRLFYVETTYTCPPTIE